jgi:DNA (cytosine-5)-methyltransferase 1
MAIVGQVEIDPWCRRVLAKHWPEVPRHDDVRTAARWWGGRRAPDLVCGGFPCQPVSHAGKRLAQADERWLWPAFADIVRALRPRYVLVENVPGLLGRGMGDVLGDLAACGYDAEWDCVPAAAVGAPHIRDRVWIVAHPAGVYGGPDSAPVSRDSERHFPLAAGERGAWGSAGGGCSPDDVADTEGKCGELWAATRERPGRPASGGSGVAEPESVRRAAYVPGGAAHWPTPHGTWSPEPGMGRVADGVPRRVDRLRGLGNAVVPQVAEHIGRMIMEAAA